MTFPTLGTKLSTTEPVYGHPDGDDIIVRERSRARQDPSSSRLWPDACKGKTSDHRSTCEVWPQVMRAPTTGRRTLVYEVGDYALACRSTVRANRYH